MEDLAIQTVVRNFVTKMVVYALGIAAGFVVSHGIATEDQARQLVDPLAQIIGGGVMAVAGTVWVWYRAHGKRVREEGLLKADPAKVVVK